MDVLKKVAVNGNAEKGLLDTYKKIKQEATADGPAFGDIPLPQ